MTLEASKIRMDCPGCGKLLMVPASAEGKQIRCPSCQQSFVLEVPDEDREDDDQQPAESSIPAASSPPPFSGGAIAPLPQQAANFPAPLNAAQANSTENPIVIDPGMIDPGAAKTEQYQHGFGLEHRGWDAGMMGGLAMMAIAAIWFFGGLAFDVIFFYPLILFVIGVVGFVKGMLTGNIAGKR
jgi:LSD1 subclass zinc finger protein